MEPPRHSAALPPGDEPRSSMTGVAAMRCGACRCVRAPRDGRAPAFCEVCGQATVAVTRGQLDDDVARRRYLLDELQGWARAGLLDEPTRARLAEPYEAELSALARVLAADAPSEAARPMPPGCHAAAAAGFCADCGAAVGMGASSGTAVVAAPVEAQAATSAQTATTEQVVTLVVVPATTSAEVVPAAEAVPAVEAVSTAASLATVVAAEASVAARAAESLEDVADPAAPRRTGRILRELRPVFYENLILFLGAFLLFAGSIYFAVYFWDRLGALGPLVAGGLLSLYGLGFAGTGYLLQRRYHADLSARVLYGVATAVLPVASTLLGEPLRTGGPAIRVLAGIAVTVLCAIAYPAIVTAASLFQREIGVPFARAFVAGLWAIGMVGLAHHHAVELGYVYLATVPVIAMYRRVREVGRVFERATVVYVVGGSAYLIAAVAARVALSASPALAGPELAPLAVLLATAAIDLDVAWRRQSRATRSALGVVGVLAHGAALGAIVVAAGDPWWRVVTTLSAGLVFAVTALRHRRPSALHLAIATVAASGAMIVWLPVLAPPHGAAFGGLILLALTAGLARLGARWRKHAALAFAVPCEQWAMLTALAAALGTLLPLMGDAWTIGALGRWRLDAPALIVLPVAAVVLAWSWSWGQRRPYLAGAVLAASAAGLVVAARVGAGPIGLSLIAAGLTGLVSAIAASASSGAEGRRGAIDGRGEPPASSGAEGRRGAIDAALVLLATSSAWLGVAAFDAWDTTSTAVRMVCFVAIAGAAAAVASQRPRREIELVAVLGVALTATTGLWHVAPLAVLPGILALGLLAIDRMLGRVTLGQARPLRDAYGLAVVAVAVQAILIGATASSLASVSPVGCGLIALALLAIAARHASPWPTYAAVGCLALAGYGAPAALHLAIAPRAVANGVALAVGVIALALRFSPGLRGWRRAFLDVPLHLAALAAPVSLIRTLYLFAAWDSDGAPPSHVLLRRAFSPLGLAVLATITHGSRIHAYLAATASMLVLPAVVAWLGLASPMPAVAAALAASAVLAWLGRARIARHAWFERPLVLDDRRGLLDDLPLRLLGLWALPSASSRRALWLPPLSVLGLFAALAAAWLALSHTILGWPSAALPSAVAYGLLAVYALARAAAAEDGRRPLAIHAVSAALGLLCVELAHLSHVQPHGLGLVLLGAGYLIAGELIGRSPHRVAQAAARAAPAWAIALLLGPATVLAQPGELAMPLAGAILALAVVRLVQRSSVADLAVEQSTDPSAIRPTWRAIGRSVIASLSITWAAGLAVLWLLGRRDWLVPEALAVAALALTAVVAAWAHWWLRARLPGAAIGLASSWAAVGGVLAVVACGEAAPASAPALAPTALALAALGLATAWFGFAAVRTGAQRYGYAAEATLITLYIWIRISPLGARITAETDVIVAVIAAFVLHFAAELLQRARLTALARPAAVGATALPLVACGLALASVGAGHGALSTVQHAVLAETLGVLYTLGARRGDRPVLGALALAFYNTGLVLLWVCTHRHDALYYTVPIGVSIGLLARIYQRHLSRTARRGLRMTGALLIYFSTYYYVVQFDNGLYPVVLGGLALAGIAAGFWLELRELFGLSIGFLVLDVVSNLAYYGAHRPVLGWTLLTLAGLLLTASGVVFQLRRAQIRALVSDVRASLARWD